MSELSHPPAPGPHPSGGDLTPELRAQIESYEGWYHEIDLGDGLVTRPRHPYREIWEKIATFLGPVEFRGKSVLDVGCWDGRWSFFAESRGARSVLATDDNSQHWTHSTSGWGPVESPEPGEGFRLARAALGSKVEYRGDVSVYRLDGLGRQFDIVLFLGVYYHLTHIMSALTQLRHAVRPDGLVIIEGSASNDTARSTMDFLCGSDDGFGGSFQPERCDPSNWSIPTIRCLVDMLSACYFQVTRQWFPWDFSRGRLLLEARPVVWANENHVYRPPFGLDRYDTRFRSSS